MARTTTDRSSRAAAESAPSCNPRSKSSWQRKLAACALVALLAASLPAAIAGAATTKPVVVAITVVKGRVQGGAKRPTVKKGQVVKLVVRTDAGVEIHVHGYDLEKVPVRGKPTVIQFTAKIQGRFEVELHEPDVLLAEISVR